MKKLNLYEESKVRESLQLGIKKMSKLVGMTLGPNGRSVLIDRGTGEPLIVDDGRRVAEMIKFDNVIEQMAVRVCYGVTRKTDEKVGDGTTTSMILASALFDTVSTEYPLGLGTMTDVSEADRRLQADKDIVLDLLDKKTKKIKTETELKNIASIVAGDKRLGDIIGGMYWKLGENGHISKEFNFLNNEIEYEITPGYRFLGGNASNIVTDELRKRAVILDTFILVAEQTIEDFDDIKDLVEDIVNKKNRRSLVIIAKKYNPLFIKAIHNLYSSTVKSGAPFVILAINAPARGEEAFKDIGIFTKGKCFTKNDDIKQAKLEDLGYAREVNAEDDTVIIREGAGSKMDIAKRITEVKKGDLERQKLAQFKNDRRERISSLSGGVGVIKIGAPTDEEKNWLKYKIEDAVYATKHAMQHGYVKGGGMAFKSIADELPDTNILKQALLAPYEKLKQNSGGKFTVGKDVIDPVIVEKTALENAVSAVSKLIRIGGVVSFLPKPELEEAFINIANNQDEN